MKITLLIVCAGLLAGCASGTRDLSADALPQPFELIFAMRTTDGRAVRYQLDDNASFGFSGGMGAFVEGNTEIGKLTDAQRLAVWRWLYEHDLLRSDGPVFARPNTVQYDLTVRAGATRGHLTVVDPAAGSPEAQALSQLNALLFGYQADMRYGQVIQPIEVELQKKR